MTCHKDVQYVDGKNNYGDGVMREIMNINEVIDRLLDSGFDFRLEDNKLIIKSYPNREKSFCVLGFNYWGTAEEFVYDLESNYIKIEDIICDAFNTYKEYVEEYLKNKIAEICEKL